MRHDSDAFFTNDLFMNPDKKQADNSDKKQSETQEKVDAVETPPPPQHMDPSKKPATEKTDSKKSVKKTKK